MHQEIATETLKTGEELRIECVTAPDARRQAQIEPFLGHKGATYVWHIEEAFAGRCDGLETRFYIGLIGDEMVGNIMTVESVGVGIFGHVNTRQDHRRKGVCASIMRHQMEEFQARDGRVLLLGTGHGSAAYRIYESFGFRDWKVGHPGHMRYDNPSEPDFEARFFAPGPVSVHPAEWRHWPLVALLAAIPAPTHLRSLSLGVWGVALLEGSYSRYLHRYLDHPRARAAVLESETGAVTAIATCVPDERWKQDPMLLDVMAHPSVTADQLSLLLDAMPLAEEQTQCCADPNDTAKIEALKQAGYERTAILPRQFRTGDVWHDAWLYARSPD